ncbi:E3 ubiquitin-protein ligase ORTHRUS 2 [Linum perenne]
MASVVNQLPCDNDGNCMVCKAKPLAEETLACTTCATPWHVPCLSSPIESMASVIQWVCPDCNPDAPAPAPVTSGNELVAAIRAIEADSSLSEQEKARKRQQLLSGKQADQGDDDEDKGKGKAGAEMDALQLLTEGFKCSGCMQLPDRPVTTPCGHNFCLKCFEKWAVANRKPTCPKCRADIPPKMAKQPRINSSLVAAIRMAKVSKTISEGAPAKVYHFVLNENRPDKAYTTERAIKTGKANAAGGKIFVTVAPDHFGPIPAENDPVRNQGVLVGECWEDRHETRQWGAHRPHVSGIAGQSAYGAQSVALSGGYLDDEDHGEWFLYTGSGGRDLSGNKRTNKDQAFDQTWTKSNLSLKVSCMKGYPVRVVRSHKEKRSNYAPEAGVRYDGVYRIEKCWRKVGVQGFKVCRYLFVRCDNEPAPWTSDEHGDRPRPLPNIPELKKAVELVDRKDSPSWDFDEASSRWVWKKDPPASSMKVDPADPGQIKRSRKVIKNAQNQSLTERLLKEFNCLICLKVMNVPVTTPCSHNFCKDCLDKKFPNKQFVEERSRGGRTLRSRKVVLNCPCCPTDISEFLKDIKVNSEVMGVIERLQTQLEEAKAAAAAAVAAASDGSNSGSADIEEEISSNGESTMKRQKVDGNDSPSSPLHVQSPEN